MIQRLACLAVLCACSLHAAAQTPIDWATAVMLDLGEARTAEARLSDVLERGALPGGMSILVHHDGDGDALQRLAARSGGAGIPLVISLSAAALLETGLPAVGAAGFLVDGDGPHVDALKKSAGVTPDGPLPPFASTSAGVDGAAAVVVDPPAELLGSDADWEAGFAALAAASPPRVVRVPSGYTLPLSSEQSTQTGQVEQTAETGRVEQTEETRRFEQTAQIARLLLVPAGVILESPPDDPVVLAAASFRLRHPAVGAGRHERLAGQQYAFRRSLQRGGGRDEVVIVFGADGPTTVNVSRAFADDTLLRDAVSGRTAFVSFGMARFEPDAAGILLIEEAL